MHAFRISSTKTVVPLWYVHLNGYIPLPILEAPKDHKLIGYNVVLEKSISLPRLFKLSTLYGHEPTDYRLDFKDAVLNV